MRNISKILDFGRNNLNKMRPVNLAILLFIITLSFLLLTPKHTFAGGDLAMFLNGQVRVAQGETPYKDFWTPYGALESYLPGTIYKYFGESINSILIINLLISSLVVFFTFVLAWKIFKDNFYSVIVALLVFFNGLYWRTFYYIHAYILFLLISAIFLIVYLENKNKSYLLFSGIFSGIAFLFKVELAGAYGVALGIFLIFHNYLQKNKFSNLLNNLFIVALGFALPFLLLVLIYPQVSHHIFKDMIFDALDSGTSMNLPYFHSIISYKILLSQKLSNFVGFSPLKILEIAYLFINIILISLNYLLPFIVIGYFTYWLKSSKTGVNLIQPIIFMLLWSIMTLPKSLGRSAASQLSHALMPLFFVQIALFIWFSQKYKPSKIVLSFKIITLSILILSAMVVFSSSANVLIKENYEIRSQHGSLLTDEKNIAEETNKVIQLIYQYAPSDEDHIFVSTQEAPPFYALTNRKNPTYYSSMFDVIIRPSVEKQKKMCADLIEKNTKIIIHDPYWGFDKLRRSDRMFLPTAQTLHNCIVQDFEFSTNIGKYQIYLPKSN